MSFLTSITKNVDKQPWRLRTILRCIRDGKNTAHQSEPLKDDHEFALETRGPRVVTGNDLSRYVRPSSSLLLPAGVSCRMTPCDQHVCHGVTSESEPHPTCCLAVPRFLAQSCHPSRTVVPHALFFHRSRAVCPAMVSRNYASASRIHPLVHHTPKRITLQGREYFSFSLSTINYIRNFSRNVLVASFT